MLDVTEIRYAFERDMVRRLGAKAFMGNGGIIRLCVECEHNFDAKVGNQVVCDDCREERVRRQTKERVRRHRAREVRPEYEFTEADKDNLVTALIRACVQDMLARYATPFWWAKCGAESWLTEFAEPYMAACGERINIDSILEKIDDQEK